MTPLARARRGPVRSAVSCPHAVLGLGCTGPNGRQSYGRDSLLLWINPLHVAMQTSLGLRVGLRSQTEVLDRMQKDVIVMADRGYRVAASDEYDLPVLLAPGQRASYYRVNVRVDQAAAFVVTLGAPRSIRPSGRQSQPCMAERSRSGRRNP